MIAGTRAAVLALAFLGIAAAQTKVGVINSQKAVIETAEIKKAQAELETKFKPRQDALNKIQKDLQDLTNQLNSGKVDPNAAQDLQLQGQRKQREAQRLSEDLQADVERERNAVLQRIGGQMQEVVKKLADSKGLDVVIDTSNTVYFKPALDLTADATVEYDKQYPVK